MLKKPALLILAFSALLCSCTSTIESGEYGPFRIGESKRDTLRKVQALDRTIEPLPNLEVHIESPSRSDLERLSGQSGVLVWIEREPQPLRIEFSDRTIDNTWPRFDSSPYRNQAHQAYSLLAALQATLVPGTSDSAAFDAISSVATQHDVSVGVFVVGYQQFRTGENTDAAEFEALLLATDAWRFDGLRDELWGNPYYSRVTLYFDAGALERIEHWWSYFAVP